jgi:Tfp pilus assembly ATPase PilU
MERKEAKKENILAMVIKKASDIMIGVGAGPSMRLEMLHT